MDINEQRLSEAERVMFERIEDPGDTQRLAWRVEQVVREHLAAATDEQTSALSEAEVETLRDIVHGEVWAKKVPFVVYEIERILAARAAAADEQISALRKRVEAELHHAEANGHHLCCQHSQGVAPGQRVPAVRNEYVRAALADPVSRNADPQA